MPCQFHLKHRTTSVRKSLFLKSLHTTCILSIKKMEAITFDASTLELEYRTDFERPKITSKHQVLVKIEYSGVCGTDLHIIKGEFPINKKKPVVLGHEFSGIVEDASEGSVFKKGQRVVVDPNRPCALCPACRSGRYNHCKMGGAQGCVGTWTDGGWATCMVFPEDQVFAIPDEVTLEQGALCEPYSCVAHGFSRASPLVVGSKILVLGAGIIGNLWVALLHHHGHRTVSVSEVNVKRLQTVKNLETGYRLITPDVLEKEKDTIGYDVIIDCTGVVNVMNQSLSYLESGGKYVVFGCCPADQIAAVKPFDIFNKELSIIGVKINPYTFPKAIDLLSAMGDRYLSYSKLGVKVYKLSEYKQAFDDLKIGSIAKAMFKIE